MLQKAPAAPQPPKQPQVQYDTDKEVASGTDDGYYEATLGGGGEEEVAFVEDDVCPLSIIINATNERKDKNKIQYSTNEINDKNSKERAKLNFFFKKCKKRERKNKERKEQTKRRMFMIELCRMIAMLAQRRPSD